MNHQRSIYSALDFLADIGGLYEIMLHLGNFITAALLTVTNISLDKKLVKLIFVPEDSYDAKKTEG